ncbi:MAG: hypothetical protein HLUCCA13_13050 [Halomonas sp. HL-48]|nr:hypothetical protein [Halomonas sp. HL-48]KPQ23503.1 MAG: hypothetical protein HLUCCA13_13050 [Halomonas sp. HL-48]
MGNVGSTICESVRFISAVGVECERLAKLIKQEMSELLLDDEVEGFVRPGGSWIAADDMDEHCWVSTALAYSLPIIVKPKRTVSYYLVFQISLSGSGVDALNNNEPIVHIGWWTSPVDFEDYWMGFPLETDDNIKITLDENVLFRWSCVDEWLYSIRLTEINTIQDVEMKIVKPVKALLCSKPVREALPSTLGGLVHYAAIPARPGSYQVVN